MNKIVFAHATTTMKSMRVVKSLLASAGRNTTPKAMAVRSVSHLVAHNSLPESCGALPTLGPNNNHHLPSPMLQGLQKRSIFIQSEDTPNPESVKFVPTGVVVLPDGDVNGYYVTKSDPKESILRSPLAKNLFKIEGIKAIYLGADFVTITKFAQTPWKLLRPQILDVSSSHTN